MPKDISNPWSDNGKYFNDYLTNSWGNIGYPNASDSLTAVQGIEPVSIDELSSVYYINEEPAMPIMEINIKLSTGISLAQNIVYSGWIEYSEHDRNDKTNPINGISSSTKISFKFDIFIQGGTFSFKITVPYIDVLGHFFSKDLTGTVDIRGINPSKETVKNSLSQIELLVIGYQESKFRQFDSDGLPTFGAPHGFGIMQLDTPPPTASQIWNWKENVDAGIALFNKKASHAKSYPERIRKIYPDVKDFDDTQLKLETYQEYNGGNYWEWDDIKKLWTKVTESNYADDCLNTENLVTAGNFPSEWN